MYFEILDLGLIDFKGAEQTQKELHARIKDKQLASTLIFCQHYPVITLGRRANQSNILISNEGLKTKGISTYAIERGGDVTYHGPGQITVYPIFNLNYFKKDIHYFLRFLEDVVIDFLSDFRVKAMRLPGLTGVWIRPKQKIASIGIAIKNWITFHGVSINIKNDDLDNFSLIKPCGMDLEMVSLETALGKDVQINGLKDALAKNFKRRLES